MTTDQPIPQGFFNNNNYTGRFVVELWARIPGKPDHRLVGKVSAHAPADARRRARETTSLLTNWYGFEPDIELRYWDRDAQDYVPEYEGPDF